MRLCPGIGVALLAAPATGIAQELPESGFAPGTAAVQDEVPPGPAWPRGLLIGGVVGGGAGLALGLVVCAEKTVVDPALDPKGRIDRPSDCVIAVGVAGLVVGALVGHAIDRGTREKSRFAVVLVPQRDRRIGLGASIGF